MDLRKEPELAQIIYLLQFLQSNQQLQEFSVATNNIITTQRIKKRLVKLCHRQKFAYEKLLYVPFTFVLALLREASNHFHILYGNAHISLNDVSEEMDFRHLYLDNGDVTRFSIYYLLNDREPNFIASNLHHFYIHHHIQPSAKICDLFTQKYFIQTALLQYQLAE